MAIRALPALILILFLPDYLEAYEADYISSPEAEYAAVPPPTTITVSLEEALAFRSVLFKASVSNGAENVRAKLGNVNAGVIAELAALRNADPTKTERMAIMCPSNVNSMTAAQTIKAYQDSRTIERAKVIQTYAGWLARNPGLANDMRLWVWEVRSNKGLLFTPGWTVDYATQDPAMLEAWRMEACGNAQLQAMGVFDEEENTIIELTPEPASAAEVAELKRAFDQQ